MVSTARASVRWKQICLLSGDHQNPRRRPSSSCATNSATPYSIPSGWTVSRRGGPVRDEPQIAVANERDGPAIGRQMGIVDGALRIDDTPGAGRAIDQVELAAER